MSPDGVRPIFECSSPFNLYLFNFTVSNPICSTNYQLSSFFITPSSFEQKIQKNKRLRRSGTATGLCDTNGRSIEKHATIIGAINTRFDLLEVKFESLQSSHNLLVGRMDEVDTAVTDHETRLSAAEDAIIGLRKECASLRSKSPQVFIFISKHFFLTSKIFKQLDSIILLFIWGYKAQNIQRSPTED